MLALASCMRIEEPDLPVQKAPEGERVQITFDVAVPCDSPDTKAMGNTPTIDPDGFYVAVFGGSGYFNEWVKATVVSATANYDSGNASTKYTLNATLAVSDSRLRVHFIANCPVSLRNNPPIAGSQDTEENVLSQIRSQRSDTYNDGYWQKIILPNGVKAEKVNNVYVATNATLSQFPDPIVLVRDFARVYLRNSTPNIGDESNPHQLVRIVKFGLAYAPSEGVIAPILSSPFTTNASGTPITVADDDETTPLYFENFFLNYQNYPIGSITSAPYNYGGYSPSDQAYDYYTEPGHSEPGVPLESDLQTWDNNNPENNVLYVYERTIPSSAKRATRIIILAERIDQNGDGEGEKFYALDIVNSDGVAIPLLRNQSYTVHLKNIESGSGEDDITKAATATSATVTGDPNFQNLVNISDGKSSIGTSFTEKFYVKPQDDYVMFRYIPTNVTDEHYTANQEGNELITIQVGVIPDSQTGVFTELTTAEATSQGVLTFKTDGDNYKVWIDKNGNDVIQYVRSNNTWVEATAAQISNSAIEKWGMIKFQLNESYKDTDNYFTQERTMVIHVSGTYDGREMSRNVVIKTSPRQAMHVICQQKYVAEKAGEPEIVRVLIPKGLSRSVFPLEFTVEPDGYSLTPDGDVLPVAYGTSTIDGNDEPAYYFVKTLTQTDYDALDIVTKNGIEWKYFDCNFKTTVSKNACTVYIKNRFFNNDNASDEFFNYTQRQFTWSNQPSTVYRHGNTTFRFVIDNAHSSGNCVWWDPFNTQNQSPDEETAQAKGLSTSNRVLPLIMTVTMNGFTPQYQEDGTTPVTAGLVYSDDNKYLYHVGTEEPYSTYATVELALTATGTVGSTGSVTLSTENITENPELYASLTSNSVSILGSSFSNVGFSGTYVQSGLNRTVTYHFTYQSGIVEPAILTMEGLTLDGTGQDNTLVTSNSNGIYTLTPTDLNKVTYTIAVKTTYRYSPCKITLSAEDYSEVETTINRQGVTINTTNANFSNNDKTETVDGVTVTFSNTTPTFGGSYTTAPTNTDITVSVPSGCHLTKVEINYTSNTYRANSVSVRSGDGSYSYTSPTGTWTAANNSTTSVTLRTTRRNNNDTRIASIVVYCADN